MRSGRRAARTAPLLALSVLLSLLLPTGAATAATAATGQEAATSQETGTTSQEPAATGQESATTRNATAETDCAHPPLNGYNSAPTAADPVSGCRTFTAPAAGLYDAYAIRDDGYRTPLRVEDATGAAVCEYWISCTLPAAGEYTVRTESASLIIDRSATTGCEPVGLGLYKGEFTAAGETDCLSLPLPAGAQIAAVEPTSSGAPHPAVTVVDATGEDACPYPANPGSGTCVLTGKAPFRVLTVNDGTAKPTGPYALSLHRTDAAADCQVLPAGDFTAASPSARATTGNGSVVDCLTIPASDHSVMEVVQLQAAPGTGSLAHLLVVDTQGKESCRTYTPTTSTWISCALTPGVAHTVLVIGRDAASEYVVTRRDVTATAKGCAANPATRPGGASTEGTLGAPGELRCRQVTTGDTEDVLHIDARDAQGTATVALFGDQGQGSGAVSSGPRCTGDRACAVTGSTHYQAVVHVPAAKKAADTYRFDAIRIAGADGPAAECDQVKSIAYGYGPITGTLDEQHATVCAALPTVYSDRFPMEISDTTGATETAVPALHDPSLDNGCSYSTLTKSYECRVIESYSRELTPSILVLSLPEKVSTTSYKAEAVCSGLCGGERVTLTKVSPNTAPAGGKTTVTVTGSALHEQSRLLLRNGDREITGTTLAVSPDRRTLTAEVDLTGAPEGAWSAILLGRGNGEYGKLSFTVTSAPLTSTAPPTLSGEARVGEYLTATTGTWSPKPTSYSYQWYGDGKPISGATRSVFTIPASLMGKKVGVTITAHRETAPDATASSATLTAAKGYPLGCVVCPEVKGSVKVGAKLTATSGTWNWTPSSVAYQWKADGKAISGATSAGYTVPASLLGKRLSLTVTARLNGFGDGQANTVGVKVATGSAPKATKKPTISGTAKVGRVLKAAHGTWTPAPTSYTYQWYANGKAISKATKSSLTLKSAQRGKKITVKVTARRTGHANGTATSAATKAVAR
ncbi:hypothetical protein ACFV97_24570 [Streptomyces sp. NPDC059913]|uniref:hypothetical protein n=1 Tax=unclassified Streptomyces TaxID=2593676 RepID=UPI00366651B5